jgi:anti-sigma factor ChrR (cupin superfamily)
MRHREAQKEQEDAVALYVLNLLDEPECSDLEAHLREGCTECRQHLAEIREKSTILGGGSVGPRPSAALRDRVLASVRQSSKSVDAQVQVWKHWTGDPPAAIHIVRADEGSWEKVAEGVLAKRLYVDPKADTVTMMVRMDAGASYRAHRHSGPEQCYVLEGDLRDAGVVVRAGDYKCLSIGTNHGKQTTEAGCLLLIVSSLHDQFLD